MSTDVYERVLCVKPEVQVFTRIPPRTSNRGYRASEWKLDAPDWTGRLRIVARGKDCVIRLEDKGGELFAEAPVEAYPSIAVEAVLDSSRYFVIRISDGGRKAFIGIGFTDRGDSFDFNVALQDHFKWLKQSKEIEEQEKTAAQNPGPKLDLGFKEGQTIKINIGNKKAGTTSSSRPRSTGGGTATPGLLPPPPGGKVPTLPPPGQGAMMPQSGGQNLLGGYAPPSTQQQQQLTPNNNFGFSGGNNQPQSNFDLLGGFGGPPMTQPTTQPMTQPQTQQPSGSTDWGDFTSAQTGSSNPGWVTF